MHFLARCVPPRFLFGFGAFRALGRLDRIAAIAGFFQLFIAIAGLLLITGLWTPVVASVMALLELWRIISRRGDLSSDILLCTLAFAIALLGPGSWSVDARLFGWKRIEIDTQKNKR